jgi:hypothetical protein
MEMLVIAGESQMEQMEEEITQLVQMEEEEQLVQMEDEEQRMGEEFLVSAVEVSAVEVSALEDFHY